ncbi:osmotically inducible protein OsmC [Pedobacter lusitanus]|uniref:Osmotically inducible protein OsmC n=1 Tax=Pedobacter lusitanus TaxID=1503925 RepID=A0A0D0FRV7_9SPHI|nr:OsmC family protein [Pedobacter lusitanus]KIO75204.1 osmotically inducible protein OsmC [Pedobacter lusitanus]
MDKKQITAVTELDRSHYLTKVYAGGHFIYADEPTDVGGTDEGMNPGALLLASLGSCTAITIRMYADRKNMALESIRIHLAICNEEQMDAGTKITREIEFTGDLSEAEISRLMQIADKCPIHKILTNPIQIETTTA